MHEAFWRDRWQEGKIGFHEGRPNAYLQKFAEQLPAGSRVLVPLCGKAEDLAFLAGRHAVCGVELVEDAVRSFFDEHCLAPTVTEHGAHRRYEASGIQIVAGDFFATTPALLGTFGAVYDRAALVALPPELRVRYAAHVRALVAPGTPLLQVTLEYDQAIAAGPPFSVTEAELRTLYPDASLTLLDEAPDARSPERVERCYLLTL